MSNVMVCQMSNDKNNMRCHAIWEAWVLCHDVLVHSGVTRIVHHPNKTSTSWGVAMGVKWGCWVSRLKRPTMSHHCHYVQCPVSTPVMSIVQCPVVIVSVIESSHSQDSAACYEERVRFKCALSLGLWQLSSIVLSNVMSSILCCPINILSNERVVYHSPSPNMAAADRLSTIDKWKDIVRRGVKTTCKQEQAQ